MLGTSIGRRPLRPDAAVPDGEPAVAPQHDRYERLFVYAVLVASAIAVVGYVAQYGRDIPFWDEWEFVSVLTGEQPVSLSWLWQAHNDHRIPIARVAMVAAWRFGLGHQVVMFASIGLLVAAAVAFVAAARRLRGRSAYTDAVLAIAFLQWGHYENLIFAIQLFFVAAVVFACGCVIIIALDRWRGNTRALVLFGVLLALVPLNGAMGIVLAVPLVLWTAVAAVVRWRGGAGAPRRDALILGIAAGATTAIIALYLWGLTRGDGPAVRPTALEIGSTALEVFSLALGPAGRYVWPISGIFVVLVAIVAALHLLGALYVERHERLRALGLLLGLGGFTGLGFVIGLARAGLGPGQGFSDRYMILVVPIVCLAYLIALIYMPAHRRAFVCASIATALALLLYPGYEEAKVYALGRTAAVDTLVADAQKGIPSRTLAARHFIVIYPNEPLFAERLEMLRRHRRSLFENVDIERADCAKVLPVDVVVLGTNDVGWTSPVAVATGPDPFVILDVGRARQVCSVEVTYAIDRGGPGPTVLTAYWMQSGVNDFSGTERFETVSAVADTSEHTATFWINGVIDRLRLDSDGPPTKLTIKSIVVIEP